MSKPTVVLSGEFFVNLDRAAELRSFRAVWANLKRLNRQYSRKLADAPKSSDPSSANSRSLPHARSPHIANA